MTGQGSEAKAIWQEPEFARTWVRSDGAASMLELPRRLAAALVADDRPQSQLVVDVASGPGDFLGVLLQELPEARGIWVDASETMLEEARVRLAPFEGRVSFLLGDMTQLAQLDLPQGLDVLVSSRALHHLDREELVSFYRSAAERLAPGGWLFNLDHVGPAEIWDARLRRIRRRFVAPSPPQASHHHNYPLTSVADHLDALHAAEIQYVELVWRAFYTCLFAGRKAD